MSPTADFYFAIATIIAILVGPVIAVLITRWTDRRRAQKERQWAVFRSLMQHRRSPMNAEHVGALNLVEVEFANVSGVVKAWKNLLASFETVVSGPLTQEQDQQLADERKKLLALLLDAIAKHLGIKVEQLDIFSGGYSPQGWALQELEQNAIRRMFGEIALGERGFPIDVRTPPPTQQSRPNKT